MNEDILNQDFELVYAPDWGVDLLAESTASDIIDKLSYATYEFGDDVVRFITLGEKEVVFAEYSRKPLADYSQKLGNFYFRHTIKSLSGEQAR